MKKTSDIPWIATVQRIAYEEKISNLIEDIVREFARLLKPEGIISILKYNRPGRLGFYRCIERNNSIASDL